MLPDTVSRLTIVVVLLALAGGLLAAGPASASDKTNRLLAGIAAGLIIGAALSDGDGGRDRCHGGYGPPPPPRYDPPRGYCPGPRQAYNEGYRDGFGDGAHYGRYQGYGQGYGQGHAQGYAEGHAQGYHHGYADGRTDQWYADSYGYRRPTVGYRPPRPVCW